MIIAIIVGLGALYAFCGAVIYGFACAHDGVDRLPDGFLPFFLALWPIIGAIFIVASLYIAINSNFPSVVKFPTNLGKWIYHATSTYRAYRARRKEEQELTKQAMKDMQDDL